MKDFRKYLTEADTRASTSFYNFKEIGSAQNYQHAKNELEKIAKDKEHAKEYIDEFKGDINAIKDKDIKFAIAIISHKANVKEDQAKPSDSVQSAIRNKNTPKEAEELLNSIGFKPLDSKEAQTLYSSLLPEIKTHQENRESQQTEKIPETAKEQPSEKESDDEEPEEDNGEDSKEDSEEEPEKDNTEEEKPSEETPPERYAGKDPSEIASKIEALAKEENEKLRTKSKENPRSQRIYAAAQNELDAKLRKYAERAEKQQSRFSVHPTPLSKQRALTNAQIAYNYAQSEVRMVNNKYLRKELGSTASNMAKSVAGALKNAKENVKGKIENSRAIQNTSDLVKRGIQAAAEGVKSGYAKTKEGVERGVQNVIDTHDAKVASAKTNPIEKSHSTLNKAVQDIIGKYQAVPAPVQTTQAQNNVQDTTDGQAVTQPVALAQPVPTPQPAPAPQPVAQVQTSVPRVVKAVKKPVPAKEADTKAKRAPRTFTVEKKAEEPEKKEKKKVAPNKQLHFTEKSFNQKKNKLTPEQVLERKRAGAKKAAEAKKKTPEDKSQGMLNFSASVDTSSKSISKNIRNRIRGK